MSKITEIWQNLSTTLSRIISSKSDQLNHLPSEASQDSIKAKSKQKGIFWLSLIIILISLVIYRNYQLNTVSTGKTKEQNIDEPMNIQVASSALDADKMWRNHFEDKIVDTDTKVSEKLKLIQDSFNQQAVDTQNQVKVELDKLKAQLEYISAELGSARRELGEVKVKSQQKQIEEENITSSPIQVPANINVNHLDRAEKFDYPKSSRNYIPETAYVKGVLLGGIAVSTSVGSSSEPIPVIIRITDRGNLPKNFNIDLTHCQIMGSSYGDLSSERAVVRAEILSCQDPVSELIYTTKIVGIIFGDDGMNGIKGKVVQTSGKHLKNAMIGGMISGIASSAKKQEDLSVTSLGAISTRRQGVGEIAQNGLFSGASNAAEKIADYYIKQAESMSPVLLVSGGVKVDIVFTKGVYLGALDVQEKLEIHRSDNAKDKVKK